MASKNAIPLYKKHKQPRIPLNGNYYDLSDKNAETWKWQANLANKYNIFGFCIYHYWFKGKQLLEKPMEILLEHKEIDVHYCICWANQTWRRTWYGYRDGILMEQQYGDKNDWICHFLYLLPFFQDERYIKVDNKPMVNIYNVSDIDCLSEMRKCWEELAKENGFSGIYLVGRNTDEKDVLENPYLDACYNFEPRRVMWSRRNKIYRKIFVSAKIKLIHFFSRILGKSLFENKYSIRRVYHLILSEKVELKKKVFLGICPEYDDTPRHQKKGTVYEGATPRLFKKTLYKLLKKSYQLHNDFVYINAWNEWGETAYLEPDQEHGYAYLEAIKHAQKRFEGELGKRK